MNRADYLIDRILYAPVSELGTVATEVELFIKDPSVDPEDVDRVRMGCEVLAMTRWAMGNEGKEKQ